MMSMRRVQVYPIKDIPAEVLDPSTRHLIVFAYKVKSFI